jgi:release factor glutamine methyltransferase
MNPLPSAARRLVHLVWRRRVRASLERTDACSLFGLDLLIAPGVLHPRHFASSRVLGRYLMSLDLRGKHVADLGTGSGILALLAARSGALVTAIDVDPPAAACASLNARRNELEDRVNVVTSDVFDQLEPGRRFDLVVTNPPFYPRAAKSAADHAFAAGLGNGFFARLAASLRGRLVEGGALVMIQSSDADFGPIGRMFEERGFKSRVAGRRRGLFETLTLREFR